MRPFWLMVTKGYGLTIDDIDNSSPADLKPYADAYYLERKTKDADAWSWCGNYVMSAVVVAVDHVLNGRKAESQYISEPVLQDTNEEMTQDELQREREALVMRLRTMKANWDIANKR